jgi:hypothetical protein
MDRRLTTCYSMLAWWQQRTDLERPRMVGRDPRDLDNRKKQW